ncbi:MAG TPA: RnfABCDGE type electron transport complex subunit D [Petrotogaceae bacterium]|nr:RnfABCDGE type electron transport complex subunit D [Petrotogaceae bacterium]HNY37397.1 RnfABCDGE type electron transport complex subunit D [Petrotogaceae bacterium]HOG34753.1 RnfABCDGE type electron transport complex subunit D [Petrotogaceae bacterium]HPX16385.1 RnfABCDGE type electron transport complex subunit D [Petrotogaceae bacterium]HQC40173.1 RnfABCDGE type electron transport complex subunit D [Petrotogaceae bacterium]
MKLSTSSAPHVRSKDTTRAIMLDVLIALMPAVIVSTLIFGVRALLMMLFSMVSAEIIEYICVRYVRGRKEFKPDFSAAVTGLLLGMNISVAVEWWQLLIGVIVSIVLAKQVFGGLGSNIFNPALVGRVFMLTSFPIAMTTWYKPYYYLSSADTITAATALGTLKTAGYEQVVSKFSYLDMFLGNITGSIGEVSFVALLLGFIYLLVRGRIKIMVPLSYTATVLIFSSIFYLVDPVRYGTPLFHILAGGFALGAFFMATDMVTSPMTPKGCIIFGMGLGVITMVIRYFGGYPEGVSYSILVMNALVPLIDRYAKPRIFGTIPKAVKK